MNDYVFNGKPSPQTILMHYGVPGMRWGVRKSRYENDDGSLNQKGKARFAKVSVNERLQNKDTKMAVKELSKQSIRSANLEKMAKKKADKNLWVSREKYEKYAKRGIEFARQRNIYDKYLTDISSGKMKAGRDFVMEDNRAYNMMLSAALGLMGAPLAKPSVIVLKNKAK